MTADPGSPGRVPPGPAYQPAVSHLRGPRGTSTVPSVSRPSRCNPVDTPILGISSRAGTGVLR